MSLLSKKEKEICIDWKNSTRSITLLTLILVLVYVNGKSITSDSLFRQLNTLSISNEHDHLDFGKIDDQISNFTKQGYLETEKSDNNDSFELYWGPRAKAEFHDEDMIEFITNVTRHNSKCF